MLSQLDNIIFPDRCDVLEIVPSQRFVYPIYKNGSSSLYNSGYRLLEQNELNGIKVVDVYVRNPYDRFVSGVHSFLSYNPKLERETALYFINNYLFLNRHFCPQFYWLVNLKRFTNASIRINSIESLNEITALKHNQKGKNFSFDQILNTDKIHFYLSIDKVLTEDLLGQTVPFKLICQTLKFRYSDIYNELVQRSINLCNVLD